MIILGIWVFSSACPKIGKKKKMTIIIEINEYYWIRNFHNIIIIPIFLGFLRTALFIFKHILLIAKSSSSSVYDVNHLILSQCLHRLL